MKKQNKSPQFPLPAPNSPKKPQKTDITAAKIINSYGTYEIQPTADTSNPYPAIAQGFNDKIIQTDRQNKHSKNAKWETEK